MVFWFFSHVSGVLSVVSRYGFSFIYLTLDLLGFLKLKIDAFRSWSTEYGFLTWNVEFPLFPLFPPSWILIKHILNLFHVFYPFVFFAVFYRISSTLFQFTYFLFSCVLSEVQNSQCLLHINCDFFFPVLEASVGSFYICSVILIVSFSHNLISFSFLNFLSDLTFYFSHLIPIPAILTPFYCEYTSTSKFLLWLISIENK